MGIYTKSSFSFLSYTFLCSKFSVIEMLFYNQKKKPQILFLKIVMDEIVCKCMAQEILSTPKFNQGYLMLMPKRKTLKCENRIKIWNLIILSKKLFFRGYMNDTD